MTEIGFFSAPHEFIIKFTFIVINKTSDSSQNWRDALRIEMAPTFFFFFFLERSTTEATNGLLYQPRVMDDNERAALGTITRRVNRSTQEKPAPVSLCSPQIQNVLTWARRRIFAVGSR
jgi:hypothetical protein